MEWGGGRQRCREEGKPSPFTWALLSAQLGPITTAPSPPTRCAGALRGLLAPKGATWPTAQHSGPEQGHLKPKQGLEQPRVKVLYWPRKGEREEREEPEPAAKRSLAQGNEQASDSRGQVGWWLGSVARPRRLPTLGQ